MYPIVKNFEFSSHSSRQAGRKVQVLWCSEQPMTRRVSLRSGVSASDEVTWHTARLKLGGVVEFQPKSCK